MPAQRPRPYTVYLSSTLKDLEPERRAVSAALGDQCVVKHSYRASENDLVTSCLDDVAGCDLYIGILGLRYGYVPKSKNRKKLSITELEYERAGKEKIARLVFLKDEDVIPFKLTDHKTKENPPERIEELRRRAGGGADQRPALFKTPQELATEVVRAFGQFKERRPATPVKKRGGRASEPRASHAAVRDRYLEWLQGECEKVVLLGLDNKDRQNVRLAQVYVPALTSARAEEPGSTRKQAARPERQHELLLHRVGEESLYVPGAPGSGKSTFCRWLALCVARGEVPQHPFETPGEFEEKLPATLRKRFPLLCPLRQWAGHREGLAGQGKWTRKHLEDSIASWIEADAPGELTAAAFRDALKAGRLLLILDGVDEVPDRFDGHYPRRNLLTGLADALAQWTKADNRVLLTSRPYGVEAPHRRNLGLPIAELQGLPRELQSVFVHRWYAASDSTDAETKATGLLEHLDGRPDLKELRPNPMLLTALCVKYDEGARLPGDLYRLYDSVVDLVLYKRYNTEQERDLARLRLAAVALAMHQGPSDRPRATPEAKVPFEEIDDALAALNKTDPTSEQGTLDVSTRREDLLSDSGLLLPRADKSGGFYHLSFQEFLAAMRLRRTGARAADLLARHAATPEWRPTLRFLFCAVADQQSPEYAMEDFAPLATRLEPEALERDTNPALLLADCLEVAHARGWNLKRFHEPLRHACDHALAHVEPPARAHLWRTLGLMGRDDRPGVGVKDGVPDIDWVEIPPGEFLYGENRRKIRLPAFSIARYPVTHAQFEAFVEDGGYENEAWWQWPEHRPTPGRPGWSYPNHPRETVAWYEAMAFCAWLEAKLREPGGLEDGRTIRLPREQEWERAARGADGREFPWGKAYEAGRANINETWGNAGPFNLEQTSAVGIYPGGASPFDVLDMAGNVWEWCVDKYDSTDEGTRVRRVLRGGSWNGLRLNARAAYRLNLNPQSRFDFVGFRVLCSSPISVEL